MIGRLLRPLVVALERRPGLHRRVMALEGIRLAARLEVLHRVQRRTPVIVFQMGKVGSTSVRASFPTRAHPVAVQTHHLYRPRIEAAMAWSRERGLPARAHFFHADALARRVIEPGRPFRLITLVREPVGRSISNFFHNFEHFVGVPQETSSHSVAELVDILVAHERRLDESRWFPREFEPALGVDVYAHPFPHDAGTLRIPAGAGEILVLRLETPDDVKERAIAEFLDETSFTLASANVGAEKDYGSRYAAFRRDARFPADFIDRKLGSVYATHFYSPAERDEIRARWVA